VRLRYQRALVRFLPFEADQNSVGENNPTVNIIGQYLVLANIAKLPNIGQYRPIILGIPHNSKFLLQYLLYIQ